MSVIQYTLVQGRSIAAVLVLGLCPLMSKSQAAPHAQAYHGENHRRSSHDELIAAVAAAIRLARQHFVAEDGFAAQHLTRLSLQLRCVLPVSCPLERGGWQRAAHVQPASPQVLAQLLLHHGREVQGQGLDPLAHVNAVFQAIDKYSEVLTPAGWQELQAASSGAWFGVGIGVRVGSADYPVIAEVERGSPAADVGLESGDIILQIGDETTYLYDYEQLSAALAKAASVHTQLALTVQHAVSGVRREYVLPRDEYTLSSMAVQLFSEAFEPPAVADEAIAPVEVGAGAGELHQAMVPSYLWLKFFEFSRQTSQELVQALAQPGMSNPYHGVVVDLRDNGGGVLASAVMVADYLLNKGKVVTLAVPRRAARSAGWVLSPEQAQDTRSYWAGPHTLIPPHVPMVVLVNAATASAAELLASSLRAHRGAMIVGQPTAGKTSIQLLMPLPHGHGLKITSSQFWAPGVSPHARTGTTSLTPDLFITWSADIREQILSFPGWQQPMCGEGPHPVAACDSKSSLSIRMAAGNKNPWTSHHRPQHTPDARWRVRGESPAKLGDLSEAAGQLKAEHLQALFLAYQAWQAAQPRWTH